MSLFVRTTGNAQQSVDMIGWLRRIAGYTTDWNFTPGSETSIPHCPFDETELEIHLHGGASCPTCGHEFEIGRDGRLLPSDKTIDTEARGWPDTPPWGEDEQRYYRTADTALGAKAEMCLRSVFDTGGFSVDVNLDPNLDLAYVTSVKGAERQIAENQLTVDDILSYRAEHKDSLNAGMLLGAWVDGGIVYLDLSRNFSDLATAIEFARDNDQIAVWDSTNKISIPTLQRVASTKETPWKTV